MRRAGFRGDRAGPIFFLGWLVASVGSFGWRDHDLTKSTGAPLAAGSPIGYASNSRDALFIAYRDVRGHIQLLATERQRVLPVT